MDTTSIEKFLDIKSKKSKVINVHFKDRAVVTGIFISLYDYAELKKKNFWRLVNIRNIAEWEQTQNIELSRLFNGAAFTRLTVASK